MLEMPILETARLIIRPFVMEDLPEVYRLLDVELHDASLHSDRMEKMTERGEWLSWTVLNYLQLGKLYQPPYGDRAIVLKSSAEMVGSCGFVPCLAPFDQLQGFSPNASSGSPTFFTTEFGLFYAVFPAHQRLGYASEAAQALLEYAFETLHIKRLVATTDYDNIGSIGVMRKLGMRIEKNSLPTPPWLQVVGIVDNNIEPEGYSNG